MKKVLLPKKKMHVVLYERQKMRKGHPTKKFKAPKVEIPDGAIDWAKELTFPMDGNDRYGDCMAAAACHADNTWTGNVGTESTFPLNAITSWYLNLAGGDNGLDEGTLIGGWKKGVAGQADASIIEALDIDTTDAAAMRAGIYLFGGVLFMFDVPDAWIQNFDTGVVWNVPADPDPYNGHGVWENGINDDGHYRLQTWGTYVWITPAGQSEVDPSGFVCFTKRWFDPETGYAPNGLHYTKLAELWQQAGGSPVPPSPFPPPDPDPQPPPTGNVLTLTTDLAAGSYQIGGSGPATIPCPTEEQWQCFISELTAASKKNIAASPAESCEAKD